MGHSPYHHFVKRTGPREHQLRPLPAGLVRHSARRCGRVVWLTSVLLVQPHFVVLHYDVMKEPVDALSLSCDGVAVRADRHQRSSMAFLLVRRDVMNLAADAQGCKRMFR